MLTVHNDTEHNAIIRKEVPVYWK